ncbi:MAG: hypothetical protein ABR548_14360 [Actinomycetota bacterium]|nr:hypothetical protein [Actinomycetota bacterium]
MNDDMNGQSLRLADLAEVDSPEVVRSAVWRFRRRVAVWAFWIVGAAIVAALIIPEIGPSDLPFRMREAPGEAIGTVIHGQFVDVTVMDVRRIDAKTVGVHMLAMSRALRADENLHVEGCVGPSASAGRCVEQRGAGSILELWVGLLPRDPSFEMKFFSATGDPEGHLTRRAPGAPAGDPELLAKRPAVIFETVTFDVRKLGISDSIWR